MKPKGLVGEKELYEVIYPVSIGFLISIAK